MGEPDAANRASAEKTDADLPLPIDKQTPAEFAGATPPRAVRWIGLLAIAALLVMAGGIIGIYFQPPGLQAALRGLDLEPGGGTSTPIARPVDAWSEAAATRPTATTVVALGALLPRGDVAAVAPPFGASDARLDTILVSEGERVARGQLLATLDNRVMLEAARDTAEADLAAAKARLAQARADTSATIDELRAAVRRAEAAAENARSDYDRALSLRSRDVVSQATLDQRLAARDQADRAVEEAQAQLSRFTSGALDDQPEVLVALRERDAAQARRAAAERDLARAEIPAPIDGAVIRIDARPGETPPADGVMILGDIDQMTAKIEIYQTEVRRVSVGDPVTITAAALPQPLQGEITRIGLEVRRQARIDDDPAANTDARIVEAWAALAPESSVIASRYTNLQVIARIETGEEGR